MSVFVWKGNAVRHNFSTGYIYFMNNQNIHLSSIGSVVIDKFTLGRWLGNLWGNGYTGDTWWWPPFQCDTYYGDVIMSMIASQITSLTIVYSTVYSGADQRKHQSSVSLAFVWGIHRGPVNSPHKWPVTRKMCSFDDVIMSWFRIIMNENFVVGEHKTLKS